MTHDWAQLGDLSSHVIFVDADRVNIDDLIQHKPGGVVRVYGDPHTAVMYVADSVDTFDRVAGWISENP